MSSRYRSSIQSARAGIHTTALGTSVEVTHSMTRTYCTSVKEENKPKWEAESGRGDGWFIRAKAEISLDTPHGYLEYPRPFFSTKQRQAHAMAQFAPRSESDET